MINKKFTAVIPAAGIGQRMGSDSPKQYLPILGEAMLCHSIRLFLQDSRIEQVVIALHPHDHWFAQLPIAQHEKITTVTGGNERVDSVIAALANVPDDHWIFVHDAARPCLTVDDFNQLMGLAQQGQSGILACPVRDTMKCVNAQGVIEQTVDRSGLWHALTPQSFPCQLLRDVLTRAVQANQVITDEASAMEWAHVPVQIVSGRFDNLKVTHQEDLALAEYLLTRQRGEK